MKTALIPVFILVFAISVFSQGFKSGKIDASQWDTNNVLTLKSESKDSDEIQIVTKSKKLRRTSKKVKHLKINNQSYRMIESCGSINIVNEQGATILKTNRDRSEVFLKDDQRFTRKRIKGNNGAFEYVNDQQEVIVSGQVKNGVIEIQNHSAEIKEALVALCLEELLQHAYDRYLNAIRTSSFLVLNTISNECI